MWSLTSVIDGDGVNDQSWAVFLVPAFLDFLLISSCLQITVIDPIPWLSSLSYIQAGVWEILYKDIFLAKYFFPEKVDIKCNLNMRRNLQWSFLDWKCPQISKHSSNLVRRNVCKGSYEWNFAVSFCHIFLSKLINITIKQIFCEKHFKITLYIYLCNCEGGHLHWPLTYINRSNDLFLQTVQHRPGLNTKHIKYNYITLHSSILNKNRFCNPWPIRYVWILKVLMVGG